MRDNYPEVSLALKGVGGRVLMKTFSNGSNSGFLVDYLIDPTAAQQAKVAITQRCTKRSSVKVSAVESLSSHASACD
jgi:hypothetical protein